MAKQRLLVITDNTYVSAILFHGYGLPPWRDHPELQNNSDYRNKMTQKVNSIINKAIEDGFQKFDIHEAFPINLMTISEQVEVLRNIDHFMLARKYSAVTFAHLNFADILPQPKLSLIKELTLNGQKIDETDLLKIYFKEHSISVYDGEQAISEAVGNLAIEFDDEICLKYVAEHPFVQQEGNSIVADIINAEMLLEVYAYAGIQIQSSGIY